MTLLARRARCYYAAAVDAERHSARQSALSAADAMPPFDDTRYACCHADAATTLYFAIQFDMLLMLICAARRASALISAG